MRSASKRMTIAIASTIALHASLFYTISNVRQPGITPTKFVEISLLDIPKADAAQENEIEAKAVVQTDPKPTPAAQEEPAATPEPVITPTEPEPIAKEVPPIKPIAKTEPKPEPKQKTKTQQKPKKIAKKTSPAMSKKKISHQKASHRTRRSSTQQKSVSGGTQDKLNRYLYSIRVKIQRNLSYPRYARRLKIEGESVVAFKILPDGSVRESSIKLKRSSGYNILDKHAIKTILNASSFAPPPQSDMSIVLPIEFKLKA